MLNEARPAAAIVRRQHNIANHNGAKEASERQHPQRLGVQRLLSLEQRYIDVRVRRAREEPANDPEAEGPQHVINEEVVVAKGDHRHIVLAPRRAGRGLPVVEVVPRGAHAAQLRVHLNERRERLDARLRLPLAGRVLDRVGVEQLYILTREHHLVDRNRIRPPLERNVIDIPHLRQMGRNLVRNGLALEGKVNVRRAGVPPEDRLEHLHIEAVKGARVARGGNDDALAAALRAKDVHTRGAAAGAGEEVGRVDDARRGGREAKAAWLDRHILKHGLDLPQRPPLEGHAAEEGAKNRPPPPSHEHLVTREGVVQWGLLAPRHLVARQLSHTLQTKAGNKIENSLIWLH